MYFLLLDSNVWISERLLKSALGDATLYALASAGGTIGLPEVVKMETERVLVDFADRAAEDIRRSSQLLYQLTGHRTMTMAPSTSAVRSGIERRWLELSGATRELSFTHDHARQALARIIIKAPPCGSNNEQFRDCCIWQCALDLAREAPVHLVSNDHAFYEGGTRTKGLAKSLEAEILNLSGSLHLHSSLGDFLGSAASSVSTGNHELLRSAIVEAIIPSVREIALDASKGGAFNLAELRSIKVLGYATPSSNLLAVSFQASYDLTSMAIADDSQREVKVEFVVQGECTFDPAKGRVSGVEITEWTKSTQHGGASWSTSSPPRLMRTDGDFRIL